MNKKVWITVLFVLLIAAVAASALITVSFGSTQLGLREVYDIIYDHLFAGDARVNAGVYLKTHLKIVWFVRLPRTLFAMLVGAGLGICGAAMQSPMCWAFPPALPPVLPWHCSPPFSFWQGSGKPPPLPFWER